MYKKLLNYLNRPAIYENSSAKFWDDEHISKGMLEAHLNPQWDAATRNLEFVRASVDWIDKIAPAKEYNMLLDMGCGPGIYAEYFYLKGYCVTGIDLSKRSIDYAVESAGKKGYDITYRNENYLSMEEANQYDIITLIYCNFGVLSEEDRGKLLNNVYRALRFGGKFIVDVFTPKQYENCEETSDWQHQQVGFWSPKPHLTLHSLYRYEEEQTMLNQTVVVTEDEVHCYNIWEHTFDRDELLRDMKKAGFEQVEFFSDVTGKADFSESKTICVVVTK